MWRCSLQVMCGCHTVTLSRGCQAPILAIHQYTTLTLGTEPGQTITLLHTAGCLLELKTPHSRSFLIMKKALLRLLQLNSIIRIELVKLYFRQAYIVAGGYYIKDWSRSYIASTEMYIIGSSEWRVMAPLPVAVARLAGVTLSNTVYMTGQ